MSSTASSGVGKHSGMCLLTDYHSPQEKGTAGQGRSLCICCSKASASMTARHKPNPGSLLIQIPPVPTGASHRGLANSWRSNTMLQYSSLFTLQKLAGFVCRARGSICKHEINALQTE